VITMMHGIAENLQPGRRFVHCDLHDWHAFEYALRDRSTRGASYVPLRDAIQGQGDALTIDDSTVAAANAARMARKHKQPVTLFVNGMHIAERVPYWFARINAALDAAPPRKMTCGKHALDLRKKKDKNRWRGIVKRDVLREATERGRQAVAAKAIKTLGLDPDRVILPRYLESITATDLQELAALGGTVAVDMAIALGAKRGARVRWPNEPEVIAKMPPELVAKHSQYLGHALAMPEALFNEMRAAIGELPPEADPSLE